MRAQNWMSVNFFTFFFTWGIFLPYWTGWLTLDKGLSVSEASIVMGVGMIGRSLSTFLLFPFVTKLVSIRNSLLMFSITSLIIAIVYIFFDSFWMLLVITFLFSSIYPNLLPAMESSASVLMKSDRIHYGKSRSYGSIGYTIALLIVGGVTSIWNESAILWTLIAGLIGLVVSQLFEAPHAIAMKPAIETTTNKTGAFKELLQSKAFLVALSLAILLQGAHASYYNYGYIYLEELGAKGFSIGVILNVAVLLEIVFFIVADRLFSTIRISTMFFIASIGSTVRWVLIFAFPVMSVFIASQLLHAVSFGLAHYAFIQFISKRLPSHLIPTAQGMYAAFAMSLSTAFLTFFGGYLYEVRPSLAFLGMTICTVLAAVIVLLTRKKFHY